jgi:hypothetical protein
VLNPLYPLIHIYNLDNKKEANMSYLTENKKIKIDNSEPNEETKQALRESREWINMEPVSIEQLIKERQSRDIEIQEQKKKKRGWFF